MERLNTLECLFIIEPCSLLFEVGWGSKIFTRREDNEKVCISFKFYTCSDSYS